MTTSVNRLKELLFDTESQRLDDVVQKTGELQRRVDAVFERAGTEDRLQKSVAVIIDGALREAEVTKHEQLSRAVAPLVVKTIKYELKNSQDEMVDALYPITGKLVKQYVQTAMADMMAEINRKLGGQKPSELEARAKAMGLTLPEFLVAETQALKVDELFLVRRGSGDLVAHWERPQDGAVQKSAQTGSNRDVLIAGYLSGITAFSEEAFDDKKGALRSLDMDGERIFVRASPAYLLAARCSGRAPQAVEQVIDDEFVRVLAAYKQAVDGKAANGTGAAALDGLLPDLAASFEQRFASERAALEQRARAPVKKAGFGRLYALAALFILPLLGLLAWNTWQSWQAQRVLTDARGVLAATGDLRGYPITLEASPGGRALTVGGLTPSEGVRSAFVASLRNIMPGTQIRDTTGVLPAGPVAARDVSPELEALRRELEATRRLATEATTRAAAATAEATAARTRLGELNERVTPVPTLQSRSAALDGEIRRLDQRIDGLPRTLSARDQLDAFARANVVFFANGIDFLDERRASETLDRLVALTQAANDVVLRVVGYTDERGATGANAQLAVQRAERVAQMLFARGVARERVAVLGRTSGPDLSRATGVGSPNRRVAFELGYVGEPNP